MKSKKGTQQGDNLSMNLDLNDEALAKQKAFYEPVALRPKNIYLDMTDGVESDLMVELSTELRAKI